MGGPVHVGCFSSEDHVGVVAVNLDSSFVSKTDGDTIFNPRSIQESLIEPFTSIGWCSSPDSGNIRPHHDGN